jgi:hypothetical protein
LQYPGSAARITAPATEEDPEPGIVVAHRTGDGVEERDIFSGVADDLLVAVEAILPELRSLSEEEAGRPRAPGKWSPKQVLGHRIDSAANNHQRFVRAQEGSDLRFPAYDGDRWVACQRYGSRPWSDLIDLWRAYNRHLAHVLRSIPASRASVPCAIGEGAPVTLAGLASDYLRHLRHHLDQVVACPRSGS